MQRMWMRRKGPLSLYLALIVATFSEAVRSHNSKADDRCEATSARSQLSSSSLLQVHSRPDVPSNSRSAPGPQGMRRLDDEREVHTILTLPEDAPGGAADLLPPHLLELGRQLLGSDENLDELVAQSRAINVTYAGVPVTVRMLNGELSHGSTVEDGGHYYGLDTLREAVPTGMLHVLDLGGNYGVAAAAAFKKYPDAVRAIVVEPIPVTYFLLRWNLWLNGIPELNGDTQDESTPGVMVLNRGVADQDNKTMSFCYLPPHTMNAFACDCSPDSTNSAEQCKSASGISTRTLMNLLGESPIALMMVDCEGCEAESLPAVVETIKSSPDRIKRLAGELHAPSHALEDMVCQYNDARFLKVCLSSSGHYESEPLRCGQERTSCENELPFLEQLRLFRKF